MWKIFFLGFSLLLLSSCSFHDYLVDNKQHIATQPVQEIANKTTEETSNIDAYDGQDGNHPETKPSTNTEPPKNNISGSKEQNDVIQVIANPESILLLVNKHNKLPESYNPQDLVTANIPFISTATREKRKMREEAAMAIAELFDAAKAQGVSLLGVSAYRSHATQTTLFNYYVKLDGLQKARTYSALPGTSEHETGLAIDVTGGNGKCAASDCFGGTPEAKWLEDHSEEFGFIIRYPKGKEDVTGYKYEPWHLRFVGKDAAEEIMTVGLTLEEYTEF